MSRTSRAIALLLSLMLVVAACGGGDDVADPATDVPDDTDTAPAAETADEDGATPDDTPGEATDAAAEEATDDATDEAADDAPQEEVSLTFQLNWTWYPADHAYFQVGLDQGFYAEEGLDVEFREGTGSSTTLTLVGTGDAPLGFVDAGTMMRGVEQDLPVQAIGVVTQVSPMAIIFKAERGFESVEDLVGEQIAVTAGDALAQIFPAVMNANDIGADEIALVGTPNPPAKEVAVLNDQAAALLGYYTEQAPRMEHTQDVDMDWITFAEAGINTLNMSVIANTDWLADNGDVARRFLEATQRAIAFTTENPQEAAAIFSEAHPDFDVELALGQIEESLGLLQTDASEGQPMLWSAEEDWEETRRLLVDFAELEGRDVSEYYTNEFVE